jgi:hypothetical protein
MCRGKFRFLNGMRFCAFSGRYNEGDIVRAIGEVFPRESGEHMCVILRALVTITGGVRHLFCNFF